MFWEDMFEKVPGAKGWIALGGAGKPVPYGAATYDRMGRITRYLADLKNPEWRAYLKKRIDLAVESGADGVIYDNARGDDAFNVYVELMPYATSRKRDFVIMSNLR